MCVCARKWAGVCREVLCGMRVGRALYAGHSASREGVGFMHSSVHGLGLFVLTQREHASRVGSVRE